MADKEKARTGCGKRLVFALVVLAGVMVGLELLFRLLGFLPPDRPFVVKSDADGSQIIKYSYDLDQPTFRRAKPAGTFRIMVAGESTAMGFWYNPRSNFGLRLETLLEAARPGLQVEVINLGRRGEPSAGVAEVVHEAVAYQPDLMLVYSGQNEFIAYQGGAAKAIHRVRRVLKRSRLFSAAATGAKLAAGVVMLATMRNSEQNPDQPIAPPAPNRLSAADGQAVLEGYRANLEAIARDCRAAQVPLALFTMATNLRDWPPEVDSFPAGLPDAARPAARAALAQAKTLADQNQFQAAAELLAAARDQAPGYAPLSFELARARTARFRQAPAGPDQDRLRAEAIADFKRALSEEARVVVSHRAPPELSELIRAVARQEGVGLVDAEQAFERRGDPAPGFDWFDDHCHPNLAGQQVIAEAIFNLLRDRLPALGLKPGAELPPWDEPAFQRDHGLDDPFRHQVALLTGIFLGLQKDLPDNSRATRDQFALAVNTDPNDPLPAILAALVDLSYGQTATAAAGLAPWYPDRVPLLEKCLARYFTDDVDLRQNLFLARRHPSPGTPPLRGLLKSGLFTRPEPAGPKPPSATPLESYTYILDLAAGKRVESRE